MKFSTTLLDYNQASQNTILDYEVVADELDPDDRQLLYGQMGNYSIAGFQFKMKVKGFRLDLEVMSSVLETHGQVCLELSLPLWPLCFGRY